MSRNISPAPRITGSVPKLMFIVFAGLLIPPTLLVYGVLALGSVEWNRPA